MRDKGLLSETQYRGAISEGFEFAHSRRVIEAVQFVQYVLNTAVAEELNSQRRDYRRALTGAFRKKSGRSCGTVSRP